jgi:hypothetical protein
MEVRELASAIREYCGSVENVVGNVKEGFRGILVSDFGGQELIGNLRRSLDYSEVLYNCIVADATISLAQKSSFLEVLNSSTTKIADCVSALLAIANGVDKLKAI